MAVIAHLAHIESNSPTGPTPIIVPLGLADWILPLCTNVICTSLIVGRIWYMSRETTIYGLSKRSYSRRAIDVMIESGALYFVVQLVFVVVYGLNHPSENIMVEIATQIYVSDLSSSTVLLECMHDSRYLKGISSTLIIIRVGLGLSWEQSFKSIYISRLSLPAPSASEGAEIVHYSKSGGAVFISEV